MTKQALIVGGGVGGLAAALACSRAGWQVRLFERANAFSEVGAGIQMGPNVVRILHGWGLAEALQSVAAFPQRLQVRNAVSGDELGVLRLGAVAVQRYGAPYATVHRNDIHQLLLQAARAREGVSLSLQTTVNGYTANGDSVGIRSSDGTEVKGDLLIGADGLWSRIREQLLRDEPPRVTGHLAYRATLPQSSLPQALRSQQITAWLGPKLHVVQYPVRRGEWLNVVAIVQGRAPDDPQNWDHNANAADLRAAMAHTCASLRALIEAVPEWRLWALCDRVPMRSALEQAQGRVALLGDAAHPMRPYLAQGAGMAIEDAATLGQVLAQASDHALDVVAALQHYATRRWQRNARVQARSIRNGEIFHFDGAARLARDTALKLLGERLLDLPWLYGGP
jgi:salicylate hydroxylase